MDEYERHPKIVAATDGKTTEYWAAACLQQFAVDNVQAALPAGWRASMTQRRLPIETALALKMRRNDVRQLPASTKFLG